MSLFGVLFGLGAAERPRARVAAQAVAEAWLDQEWNLPERREALRRATSLLADLGPDESRELVAGVARNFYAYAADLPASEKHHHAEPFGLFDHSLEVAELALRAALSEHFVSDTRAYPEEQEHRLPRLRYAAWFLGLLHDAGKVAQVVIRSGSGHDIWNPYVEPLRDFYHRHGKRACSFSWKAGRGLDAHTWHTAYLMGRFLTGPVAEYLGSRLSSQLLEQENPAAKEVSRLVSEADHRSTRASRSKPREAREDVTAASPLLVGEGNFLGRLPGVFRKAVAERTLTTNALDADVLVGMRWILVRYPSGLLKLAFAIREALGREFSKARALTASETGARELATFLHERRRLFADRETDAWKLKVRLAEASSFAVSEAVLVDRDLLDPAGEGSALPAWMGTAQAMRAHDEKPVLIDEWRSTTPVMPAVSPAVPAPPGEPATSAPTMPVTAATAPSVPRKVSPAEVSAAAAFAPAAPALVGVRKFISGEVLLADIRQAILDGAIASNTWGQPCYVLEESTYLASPKAFQCLVDRGLYNRNPKREVNVYLDALAKLPCVRKKAVGKVLTQIAIRPGARPLWVVAFETKGLFRDAAEIARVGIWTESPIRELSDEEARSLRSVPASGPAAAALEVPHA